MTVEEWVALLRSFGVAVAILVFLGLCFWRLARWLAPKFDTIFNSYVRLLDALTVSVARQGEAIGKFVDVLDGLVVRQTDAIAKFINVLDRLGTTLARIEQRWQDMNQKGR